MPICQLCGDEFRNWQVIDGHSRNLSSRKYCLTCSPYGRHNTRQVQVATDGSLARCPHCGESKPLGEFYLRPNGTRSQSWCKVCNLEHRKARFREDRSRALLHYSNGDLACVCCHERAVEFLGLDHTKDDGAEHRRSLGTQGGRHFYAWLRRTGYTYEDLAVTCHNCNMARAMYGRCPHKMAP